MLIKGDLGEKWKKLAQKKREETVNYHGVKKKGRGIGARSGKAKKWAGEGGGDKTCARWELRVKEGGRGGGGKKASERANAGSTGKGQLKAKKKSKSFEWSWKGQPGE